MFKLTFEHPITGDVYHVGPVPYVRIDGSALKVGPDDRQIGHYQGGLWHVGGQSFTVIAAEAATRIHFEDPDGAASSTHGPFDGFKLVDGVIRYGGGFSGLLARYDDLTSTWYVYADQASWPTAVFTAA
jgi:hypothetical protein